jgi:hypothetical protein
MPQPRNRQVSLEDTPYYHCISRCVPRAFLCGKDSHTGFNFEHRRQWIVDRIKLLCGVFSVDLCAYAIMNNHYHIVVRIDVEQVQAWSDVGIPYGLKDYLELVDWGGREIKHIKRGYIPASAPPILTRLKMGAAPVLNYLGKADQPTFGALGPVSMLRAFASSVGRSFIKGQSLGKRLFPETT